MTCIVGIVDDENTVWVGGDSAGVGDFYDITARTDDKVWVKDGMVFGICGSFRFGQLLKYKVHTPVHPDGMDTHEYMATEYIDEVRQVMIDNGNMFRGEGLIDELDYSDALIGYRGELFALYSDLQIATSRDKQFAIGCGGEYAKGALYASAETDPKKKLLQALAAADHNSAGVCKPFTVKKVTCG